MRRSEGKIGEITSIDGGTTWTEQECEPGMTAASDGTITRPQLITKSFTEEMKKAEI